MIGLRSWWGIKPQRRDERDKFLGFVYRLVCFGEAHAGIFADRIVRDRLEVVGLRQEGRESPIDPRIVPGKAGELAAHAAMRFRDFP